MHEDIPTYMREILQEIRSLKSRMISLESWMAALSRGKNLHESRTFAKDITDLSERLSPTLDLKDDNI